MEKETGFMVATSDVPPAIFTIKKYRGVALAALDYAMLTGSEIDADMARELLAVIDSQESDYARGYREGYERRHAEVLGALA